MFVIFKVKKLWNILIFKHFSLNPKECSFNVLFFNSAHFRIRMKIINLKVASENNSDNLSNEVLVKDHIHFEKKRCPNLVSEVVAKHDIHDDWMVKLLECPICFNVPRDLPIPACSAGHIICKKCKSTVTTCPTCRRRLYNDGINSLAA